MVDAVDEQELMEWLEAVAKAVLSSDQAIDKRGSAPSRVQTKITDSFKPRPCPPEDDLADQNKHKIIDLFTHSHLIKHGPGKGTRGGICRSCFNHSSSMDMEDWEPANHRATLQRHPAMAKREQRDEEMIAAVNAGYNNRFLKTEKIDVTPKPAFVESSESDVEQQANTTNARRSSRLKKSTQESMQPVERIANEVSAKTAPQYEILLYGDKEVIVIEDDSDEVSEGSGSSLSDSSYKD